MLSACIREPVTFALTARVIREINKECRAAGFKQCPLTREQTKCVSDRDNSQAIEPEIGRQTESLNSQKKQGLLDTRACNPLGLGAPAGCSGGMDCC
jgi:hypothetical protein